MLRVLFVVFVSTLGRSLGPKLKNESNWRKTKFVLTYSFQTVIRVLVLVFVKNLTIHFISKFMLKFHSQFYKL